MTGLYSPINKLMEQVTRPKGTGAEYMAELSKKPGYKPAEAEDRDLQALMALPQMQRAEFMEKLKGQANKFPLKHRELTGEQTHHETYTLPGGENYREILLHTPSTKREELKKKLSDINDLMNSAGTTPEQYKKLYATRAALADQYTHGVEGSFGGNAAHFGGTPNILASVRVKDRTSPEGKKILHIEEIQSDWHQQGREHGYHPKDLYAQIKAAKAEKKMMDRYLKEADEDSSGMAYGEYGRMVDDQQAATEKLDKLEQLKEEGVPYGPHAKDWHELALKAMIQHAAENGYHQIAITPGAEQAKRFGLSKQVGAVSYNPETQHFQAFKPNRETITNEKGASPERIKALIGKEAAAKLLQAPQTMGHHYLEGEDLDIGGEGMKGFYDKMMPTFLNKFGKKHGVQVQPGTVPISSTPAQHHGLTEDQFQAQSPDEQQRMVRQHAYAHQGAKTEAPVHTFDITPAMREDVLKNGIPRYAEGGDIDREEGLRKFLEPSKEKRRMYHGTRHYTRGVPGGHPVTSPEADPNYTEKMRNTGGFASITPGIRGMSFVTPDTEFANEYAGENKQANKMSAAVYPVHVQVKNPFDYENPAHVKAVAKLLKPTDNKWAMHYGKNPKQIHDRLASGAWEYIEDPDVQEAAKKLGHDAMYMNEHGVKNLGVFNPNVIKSAIGNRGTYDINEPHMNKAKGGIVKEKVTISPNMDAMQYELMGVKHFTKKAK
jgi:hypothetical protein